MKLNSTLILFLIAIITSCGTQKVSTLVGGDYDKKNNKTDYFVLPYGSTSMPGKWVKTRYNEVSNQQFFKNDEDVSVSVAFESISNYEFNTDKSKKGFEFVKAFYEWDSKYFEKQYNLKHEVVDSSEQQHYIIWHLFGESEGANFDTFFLFGEKKGNATNFSITHTEKWSKEEKIKFLKEMYLQKQ